MFVAVWALQGASEVQTKLSPALSCFIPTECGLLGNKSTNKMKPNPQFIQMITMLFHTRQKSITNNDITRHNNGVLTFYSISQGSFNNDRLLNKTEGFSDQIMIEVERGANRTIIGTPASTTIYSRTSPIEFANAYGKGFIHWQATDERNNKYFIVKLMADDGTLQFKIMTPDNQYCTVHNVCELPH